jgi:hypothetical protein
MRRKAISFPKPEHFKNRQPSPKGTPQVVRGERAMLPDTDIQPNNFIPPLHRQANEERGKDWGERSRLCAIEPSSPDIMRKDDQESIDTFRPS